MIIFYNTVEDYNPHVDETITTVADAGVTLKINKCHFFPHTFEYLGHRIKPGCFGISKINVSSLRDAQIPTNTTQLGSFLDLCNVYRRFIEYFAVFTHPLSKLLKKGSPESFTFDDK